MFVSKVPNYLPLPASFDFTDAVSWSEAAQAIQDWATTCRHTEHTNPPLWTISVNLFWLAFVAAYPQFPRAPWPRWDPRMPLSGLFIERWLFAGCYTAVPAPGILRYRIWTTFTSIVNHYFPACHIISALVD